MPGDVSPRGTRSAPTLPFPLSVRPAWTGDEPSSLYHRGGACGRAVTEGEAGREGSGRSCHFCAESLALADSAPCVGWVYHRGGACDRAVTGSEAGKFVLRRECIATLPCLPYWMMMESSAPDKPYAGCWQ